MGISVHELCLEMVERTALMALFSLRLLCVEQD
jgi:hypothetical protein